jgi:uncharacterized protein
MNYLYPPVMTHISNQPMAPSPYPYLRRVPQQRALRNHCPFAGNSKMEISEYIKSQSKYQRRLLLAAVFYLCLLQLYAPETLSRFFSLGNLSAPATKVEWLGIADGETWLSLGPTLSISITTATFAFVYFQFRINAGKLRLVFSYWSWILLFSAGNSFSEEIIFRLGVIVPLYGDVKTSYILLISAIAFGALHLRGMPNGIIGACMASLLGWLLAKSMIETNGFFWLGLFIFFKTLLSFPR